MGYVIPKIPEYSQSHWETQLDFNIREANRQNQIEYQRLLKLHVEILNTARSLYGYNSKQYKYLSNNLPEKPPSFVRKRTKWVRDYKSHLEKEKRRRYSKKRYQDNKAAIERLKELGYVQWSDFDPGKAITFEKSIKEQALEQEKDSNSKT